MNKILDEIMVHTECRHALRMFGPLNATQLSEKLALRKCIATPTQVTKLMEENLSAMSPTRVEYYVATGFSERTYK